jgi:hypothetical protein
MTTITLGSSTFEDTETRLRDLGLADNKTILYELTNVSTRVGVGDLIDLIGIEPNLSLTTLEDGGSETLLDKKANPSN